MSETQERRELLLAPIDAELLEARIAELRERSVVISVIVQEAIEQSSETTHDNAPYDVARHEKDVADKQLGDLIRIQNGSTLITPPVRPDKVSIGTIVKLARGEQGISIEIAGNWHDRHSHDDDACLVLNCDSPLAASLIGKAVGNLVKIHGTEAWEVEGIVPSFEFVTEQAEVDSSNEGQKENWKTERILFVTGPHAAGKSSLINAALDDNYIVVDTGPTLRRLHSESNSGMSFDEWVEAGEVNSGQHFTDELLAQEINKRRTNTAHPSGIVVIGNRFYEGVEYLKETLKPSDTRTIYINAPSRILYERYKEREGKSALPIAEFEQIVQAEMKKGLYRLADSADLKILNMDAASVMIAKVTEFLANWTFEY